MEVCGFLEIPWWQYPPSSPRVSHIQSASSKVKKPTLSAGPEGVHWKLNSPLLCLITSPLPACHVRAKTANNNSVTYQVTDSTIPHENLYTQTDRICSDICMFAELRSNAFLALCLSLTLQKPLMPNEDRCFDFPIYLFSNWYTTRNANDGSFSGNKRMW